MKTIKSIVVDDNQAAVSDLCQKLKLFYQIEVQACANHVDEAIQLIDQYHPQLLFLDIEMPNKNGFDLLQWFRDENRPLPHVIFVTGLNHYTLQAFRQGAIDYIIKPANIDELSAAINKVAKQLEEQDHSHKIDSILDYIARNKQIFLPTSMGFRSINTYDILYIWKNVQTDRIEVIIDENDRVQLPITYRLNQLLQLLPQADFFQIKRELIINLRYVVNIETFNKDCTLQKGDFIVKMTMSRRSMKEFKDKMVL